eukprot:15293-Heterococcus_DN1.PRE.4
MHQGDYSILLTMLTNSVKRHDKWHQQVMHNTAKYVECRNASNLLVVTVNTTRLDHGVAV